MRQKGFGVVEVIVLIIIVAGLGFVGWYVLSKMRNADIPALTAIEVGNYKVEYPESDQIILTKSGQTYTVAYKPVLDYYNQHPVAGEQGELCKERTEGHLVIAEFKDIFEVQGTAYGSITSPGEKKKKLDELISKGKAAQLKEDVYALAPTKQNEECTDIYQNTNSELKSALEQASAVEREWLKKMRLK